MIDTKESALLLSLLAYSGILLAQQAPEKPTATIDDWNTVRCLTDRNGDNKISLEEAAKVNPMPLRQLQVDFLKIDSNGDGVVDLQEYTGYVVQARSETESQFRNADTDKSGGLSKIELAKANRPEYARILRRFDIIDANKDGQVTLEEEHLFDVSRVMKRAQGASMAGGTVTKVEVTQEASSAPEAPHEETESETPSAGSTVSH